MELEFLNATTADVNEIMTLYADVINSTFTTWDENYPSRVLVESDIKNGNLYIAKQGNEIVAVSFLGKKEEEKENWELSLNSALGVARICVSPKFQGQGIGTRFMEFLIKKAKSLNADGMHFHVCTKNESAIKMYEKVGFKNYGLGKSNYGYDFYKYEQSFFEPKN